MHIQQGMVLGQLLGRLRRTMSGYIPRTCTDEMAVSSNASGDQGGVRQFTNANRSIKVLLL